MTNLQSNTDFAAIVFTAADIRHYAAVGGDGSVLMGNLIEALDADEINRARRLTAQLRSECFVDVRLSAVEDYLGRSLTADKPKFNRSLMQQAKDKLEDMTDASDDVIKKGRRLVFVLRSIYGVTKAIERVRAQITAMDAASRFGTVDALLSQRKHMETVFESWRIEAVGLWAELFSESVTIQPADVADHVYTDTKTGARYTADETIVYLIGMAISGTWTNSATGVQKQLSLAARRAKLHTAIDKYASLFLLSDVDKRGDHQAVTNCGEDVDKIVAEAEAMLAYVESKFAQPA